MNPSPRPQERMQLRRFATLREQLDEDWLRQEIMVSFCRLSVMIWGVWVVMESCVKKAQPLAKAMLPILHCGMLLLATSVKVRAEREKAHNMQSQEEVTRTSEPASMKMASAGQRALSGVTLKSTVERRGEQAATLDRLVKQISLKSGEQAIELIFLHPPSALTTSSALPSLMLTLRIEHESVRQRKASVESNRAVVALRGSRWVCTLVFVSKMVRLVLPRSASSLPEGERASERSPGESYQLTFANDCRQLSETLDIQISHSFISMAGDPKGLAGIHHPRFSFP